MKLSIDTLHVVSLLNEQQQEIIYDRFVFRKNHPTHRFHYTMKMNNPLFIINSMPRNISTYKWYNTMLIFQRDILNREYVPYSIQEILQMTTWKIKRIDLAFDFQTPTEKSLILKHHGNVQFDKNEKWSCTYLGKLKNNQSESKVAFYDRNRKEQEHNTGIVHDYHSRFEVRLYPKLNDEAVYLQSPNHDWIKKHLSKYIFIENIDDLPLKNKWEKNRLYKIQKDYSYHKKLKPKEWKYLKQICKENRVPLEMIYEQQKYDLFSFTYIKPLDELIQQELNNAS